MSNSKIQFANLIIEALHNAIMEAGSKDRPPMLAPGIYVQWKSIIKRYIDTKPNSELISISRQNPLLHVSWAEKTFRYLKASSETTTERFVTLVKQSQELKTVSYHKLYDILKQHQNEVNEIRVERLARTANPLALVAQQQPVYHHQNHPTQNTQYSSTRSQQSTRNRGKAIVTSSAPTYDPEPATVTEDEEMSKEKEIDKLMALISLSSLGIQCYQCKEYGHVSRECQKPKRVKDAAYHKEKMLLCKQEEAEVQLNAEQADWKDDTDDESDDQELEAPFDCTMAQLHRGLLQIQLTILEPILMMSNA
ncbi:retrovirus-related pol polyprotein from transposon TNT 1-94 [Tanacetum coccineum]